MFELLSFRHLCSAPFFSFRKTTLYLPKDVASTGYKMPRSEDVFAPFTPSRNAHPFLAQTLRKSAYPTLFLSRKFSRSLSCGKRDPSLRRFSGPRVTKEPVDVKNRPVGETWKKGQAFSYGDVPYPRSRPPPPPPFSRTVNVEGTRYQLVAVGILSASQGAGGSVLFYYLDTARDGGGYPLSPPCSPSSGN